VTVLAVSLVGRVADVWKRFWFERIPPHSYALLRILIGLVGVATIIGAWNPAFWDVEGIVPLGGALGLGPWLVAHGLGATAGIALRWTLLSLYACLFVGLGTDVVAPLVFLGSAVMLWWNGLPYSAAQELLRDMTLPLVFVESGTVWSIDSLMMRRRRGATYSPRDEPIWPLRLLQFQIVLLYLSTGLWKLANADWRAGHALQFVLNDPLYQRMPGELPPALLGGTVFLTYLTIAWELAFPVLVWIRRTRPVMLAIGVALHLGMWATLEVGAFTPTILTAYVAFLDPLRTGARVRRFAGVFSSPRASN
jgi:hypothetical protein